MDRETLFTFHREELKGLLSKKKELYEEIEEERKFVLGQTNIHLPGTRVREYREELKRLEQEMDTIREILHRGGRE